MYEVCEKGSRTGVTKDIFQIYPSFPFFQVNRLRFTTVTSALCRHEPFFGGDSLGLADKRFLGLLPNFEREPDGSNKHKHTVWR